MAERKVRVLRAFAGINKDQAGEEKKRYFTPGNEDTVEEFIGDDEFKYRVDNGFLSVEEVKEPEPLAFRAPQPAEAATEASHSSARRRRASATE